eukprot:Nk52_evm47s1671 gene=Nk52_evmTU47s1671
MPKVVKGGTDKELVLSLIRKRDGLFLNSCEDVKLLEELCADAEKIEFKKGEMLTEQGSPAKDFYIIDSGTCDVLVTRVENRQKVRHLDSGAYFGDLAIVYELPRAASVCASSKIVVYRIPEASILRFIEKSKAIQEIIKKKKWIRNVIESHALFKHLDDDAQREGLVRAFSEKVYCPGDVIVEQGMKGDKFFVVAEGTCEVYVDRGGEEGSSLVSKLFPGHSFGELALMYNQKRTATVIAEGPATLYQLDANTFKNISNTGSLNFHRIFETYASNEENGEKMMTVNDFARVVRSGGERGLEGKADINALNLIFQVADRDNSQSISFSEFVLLAMLLQKQNPELEIAFRFFDKDKNGSIDAEEFRIAMKAILNAEGNPNEGKGIDEQIVKEIFGEHCDHELSYEEFTELLRTGKLPGLVKFWTRLTGQLKKVSENWLAQAVTVDDSDNMVVHGSGSGKARQPYKFLIAGGIAGAISRTAVAPLIRFKLLCQTQGVPPKYKGLIPGMRLMYKEDGFRGLYRGNGSNVIRIAPTVALQFYFFETIKSLITDDKRDLFVYERLLAGGTAGIISATITYPLDFVRARLTIQAGSLSGVQYNGIIDGLKKVYVAEGVQGWFRGWTPTALGVFPYIGIDFAVYETLKPHAPKNENGDTSIIGLLTVGGIAGLVSQTAAFPLETIRRRLQVQGFIDSQYAYNGSVFEALRDTVRKEGFKGLYRGLVPNYVKAVPTIGIGFAVYERMKKVLEI